MNRWPYGPLVGAPLELRQGQLHPSAGPEILRRTIGAPATLSTFQERSDAASVPGGTFSSAAPAPSGGAPSPASSPARRDPNHHPIHHRSPAGPGPAPLGAPTGFWLAVDQLYRALAARDSSAWAYARGLLERSRHGTASREDLLVLAGLQALHAHYARFH